MLNGILSLHSSKEMHYLKLNPRIVNRSSQEEILEMIRFMAKLHTVELGEKLACKRLAREISEAAHEIASAFIWPSKDRKR